MAAKGEVRIVSYVDAGDITGMRKAARGAKGRIESVTPLLPRGQRLEIVTILPHDGFTRFQELVEADSRVARKRAGAPVQAQRRPSQRAA